MIDCNRRFDEMTIKEISAELAEHYAEALANPLEWNEADPKQSFGLFMEAAVAIHDLLSALRQLRYGDDDEPWAKAAEEQKNSKP